MQVKVAWHLPRCWSSLGFLTTSPQLSHWKLHVTCYQWVNFIKKWKRESTVPDHGRSILEKKRVFAVWHHASCTLFKPRRRINTMTGIIAAAYSSRMHITLKPNGKSLCNWNELVSEWDHIFHMSITDSCIDNHHNDEEVSRSFTLSDHVPLDRFMHHIQKSNSHSYNCNFTHYTALFYIFFECSYIQSPSLLYIYFPITLSTLSILIVL